MTARTPAIGDLVDLPPELPQHPFRVLSVRTVRPGWVELDGYLVMPESRPHLAVYTVPISDVRVRPEHWLTPAGVER
jgi:hypothetical protein